VIRQPGGRRGGKADVQAAQGGLGGKIREGSEVGCSGGDIGFYTKKERREYTDAVGGGGLKKPGRHSFTSAQCFVV